MADTNLSTTAPKKTEEEKLGLSINQPQIQGATQGYLGQNFAYTGQPNKPTGTGITQKTAGAGQYLSANAGNANQLAQQATRGLNAGPNYSFGKSRLDAGILGQARNFAPVVQAPAVSSQQLLSNVESQTHNAINNDANAPVLEAGRMTGDTSHYAGLYDYLTNNTDKYINNALSSSNDIANALAAEDMLSRQGEVQGAIGAGDFGALQEILTRGISESDYEQTAQSLASAETKAAAQRGLDKLTGEVTGWRDKSVRADEIQQEIDRLVKDYTREPNKANKKNIQNEIANLESEFTGLGLGREVTKNVNPQASALTNLMDTLDAMNKGAKTGSATGIHASLVDMMKKTGLTPQDLGYKNMDDLYNRTANQGAAPRWVIKDLTPRLAKLRENFLKEGK